MDAGQVHIRKDVVTEERTLEVPVTREEVTIERTPIDRRPSDRPIDERGESIEIPVREERVEIEKRPVVYEEVAVGTREIQETQQVSGTVRREEARIEQEGDVNVGGGPSASTWSQAMPGYRERWQRRDANTSERWEDAEPGYRYAYAMRNQPQYRGRAWSDVEPELRRDWAQRNPQTPWEQAKESVHEMWENATD